LKGQSRRTWRQAADALAGFTVFQLAISAVIGFFYARWIVGLAPMDPTNISWLRDDRATYYIGWALFRQDPHLHWPLTFTNWINYPLGDSIAFMDPNPLLAFLLKPFSPLLPHPFQYLGIEAVLLCTLQFFFGFRIFKLLLRGDVLASALSAAFVLVSPPLTLRLMDHFTLANQWIVLAAVYLFLLILGDKTRRVRLLWFVALLTAVAVGTNMYFALSTVCILCAAAFGVWLFRRDEWKFALAIPAACCGAGLLSGVAFGLLRFDGAGAPGYREHAANLLTFLNPMGRGSLILREIPTGGNSAEGFMFLGLGVLLLAVMLAPVACSNLPAIQSRAIILVAAAICCTFLMLLAVSTRVTLGSHVLDLDPYQLLTKYLSVFRASGRLAWTPFYFVVIGILTGVMRAWPRRLAIAFLSMALIVQIVDATSQRIATREYLMMPVSNPLKSGVWSQLHSFHRNLIVVPPFPCGGDMPGGGDSWRVFGMLAANQGLRTNGYYAARTSVANLKFQCEQLPQSLASSPLSPDSAYVVNAAIASEIARGPSGPGHCHFVDGFILCSTRTDFGLPAWVSDVPVFPSSGSIKFGGDASARNYLDMHWHGTENWGVWAQGSGELHFKLTRQQMDRFNSLRLNLSAYVGPHTIHYRIVSGRRQTTGKVGGGLPNRIENFTATIPLDPSPEGLVSVQIEVDDPVRPVDVVGGFDWRLIGVGVRSVELIRADTGKPN
jgi:Family of unknown function (DUF6311)